MSVRLSPVVALALLLLTGGSAHYHRVGRPPTADEIELINQSAGDEAPTMIVDHMGPTCLRGGSTCAVDGPRPISNTPPFEIERIVDVDKQRMTVVAQSGDVWHLDLSQVAGVTTRKRSTWQGSVAGGALGLAFGGLVALVASGGILVDPPVTSYGRSPPSGTTAVAIMAGFTAVGAIVGAIVGHNVTTNEYFDLGGFGRALGTPPSFSR